MSRALPEPWRVKVVEKIQLLPREERERLLVEGGFSLFKVPSEAVFIDLFTDSGTSAMSDWQWAGMMQGDEAYAGARNFFHLQESIQRRLRLPGTSSPSTRGAWPRTSCSRPCVTRPGMVVPNNSHFDTTRANIEVNGGIALDLVIPEGHGRRRPGHPFKGNMDLDPPAQAVRRGAAGNIPLVHADPDQQLRGRPAGLARQRQGRLGALPRVRHPLLYRRLPLRRERLVHQAARGRAGATARSPRSCARSSATPTAAP